MHEPLRPEETLFIGDSISFDYEGARKAGLKPLLINRDGAAQAGVETITNLTEVLNCVG